MDLRQRIKEGKVTVAIIGLGYVGLPLAVEFARAAFRVLGVDNNKKKISNIRKGDSYIEDVSSTVLKKLISGKKMTATSDYAKLKQADVIIMCVPTPLRKTKEPDVSYVLAAVRQIARHIDKPQLVILESTTYPGTTEELILPILSRKKRQVGRDFFLAYSPERVDPVNKKYRTADIPKVVAGVTPRCLELIRALYSRVFAEVVPVSSPAVAETIKLLENTFRTVNIALVDEIAIMCHKMGIDVWEVIRGAATKPFGFMPFYPGPGVGGACLPKDPHYLAWQARRLHNYNSRFVALASDITTAMPRYVISRIKNLLKDCRGKKLAGSRILVLGVAYKKDLGDTRDSPALEIIKLLQQTGAEVVYNDPYVPKITVARKKYRSVSISDKLLQGMDMAVICTGHSKYNMKKIVSNVPLVFDTRGVTWKIARGMKHVIRL